MEIRGLKARGYVRKPYRIGKDANGGDVRAAVERGGLIVKVIDKERAEPIGYRWPRVVELRKAVAA